MATPKTTNRYPASSLLGSQVMRLKLGTTREISERRQVGDAEEMFAERGADGERPWWRNVSMEEGM